MACPGLGSVLFRGGGQSRLRLFWPLNPPFPSICGLELSFILIGKKNWRSVIHLRICKFPCIGVTSRDTNVFSQHCLLAVYLTQGLQTGDSPEVFIEYLILVHNMLIPVLGIVFLKKNDSTSAL